MNFLNLENKTFLIFGVVNKDSIAAHIGRQLVENGAKLLLSVINEGAVRRVKKIFPDAKTYICDVTKQEDIDKIYEEIKVDHKEIHGMVHSIAFANYSEGVKPFHEVNKTDFMQALDISCFSFINLSNRFKDLLTDDASVLTMSINTTKMAALNYGYMAPIKACLDSSVVFLAKSFSDFSNVRFNAIGASPLKTISARGIPKFKEYYAFAEKTTLRKKNLLTEEVGNLAAFLLSDRSSGMNAQTVIIDAGMSCNYFDEEIVNKTNEM